MLQRMIRNNDFSATQRFDVATLFCTKNRRCGSSLVTSDLKVDGIVVFTDTPVAEVNIGRNFSRMWKTKIEINIPER